MTTIITPEWPAPANIVAGTTTRDTAAGLLPGGLRFPNQVHGAVVVPIGALRNSEEPLDADAVTGWRPGDVCAVRTADCLPVLFCSTDGTQVAAAHAGWRGLAAGVLENTFEAMNVEPDSLMAWLGPAISQTKFEVGDEVREAFLAHDAKASAGFEPNASGRWQADLYALARQRLASIGIHAIYGKEWCTYGDPERFYSYRRGQETGRMVSFVALK
jgi:YfiH family protein